MKFTKEIIHDKDARNNVFFKVLVTMERLQEEVKALEEKQNFHLHEYKKLQHLKVELATLEEFFQGAECKKYVVEDRQDA